MPDSRLPALLALIFGGLCCASPATAAANLPLSSLGPAYAQRAAAAPVLIQVVVTFMDPARKLIVLQERGDVAVFYSDLADGELGVGDWVQVQGIIGPLVSAFPRFQEKPDGWQVRDAVEAPENWNDNLLSRLRGMLHPPASGNYTFWIASDDSSDLWLSESADPREARRIALVGSGRWTQPRQWERHVSQKSATLYLEAGRSYYLEAIAQDTGGADNLSVAWQGPGIEQSVIDGKFVSTVPLQGGDASEATDKGVLWEYWTNFFSGDVSVLRVTDKRILRCDEARILKREPGALPAPLRFDETEPLDGEAGFRRVAVEGRVEFLSQGSGGWEMVLRHGSSKLTVHLGAGVEFSSVVPNNSRVRVSGFFEPGHAMDRGSLAGTIWVDQRDGVAWLDNNENWALVQPLPQQDLAASNPNLCVGQIVRTQGRVVGKEGADLWRIEGKDTIRGYVSSNGVDWLPAGPGIELSLSNQVLVGFAISSHETGRLAMAEFDEIAGFSSAWSGADIGNPPIPGLIQAGDRTVRVQGSGDDIWHGADQCFFAHQVLRDDFEIRARLMELRGVDYGVKAVLMVRESLSAESPWAGTVVMPGYRIGVQGRVAFGENAAGPLQVRNPSETWVKIERLRNYFMIRNGEDWLQPGLRLEILGQVAWQGQSLVLEKTRARALPADSDVAAPVPLREQVATDPRDVRVTDLREEAKRAQRMARQVILRVRGVVTFNDQVGDEWLTFVQDASGGVRIQWRAGSMRQAVQAGDWVELVGSPGLPESGEVFIVYGVTRLENGEMPQPSSFQTVSQRDASPDGQWMEVEGVGRSPIRDGKLLLMSRKGEVEVHVGRMSPLQRARWTNAFVRIRGVMRQAPKPALLMPSERYLQILEAPPDDPFGIRTFSMHKLRAMNGDLGLARMYKIQGAVTCVRRDFLFVQDDTGGIKVETGIASGLNAGDEVEVVGFPAWRANGVVLTESLLRPLGRRAPIAPAEFSLENILQAGNNGRLISVEAVLLAQHPGSEMQTIDLQLGQRAFQASLPVANGQLPRMASGSRVRVAGVAMADGFDVSSPGSPEGVAPLVGSLELLLRTPGDVLVVERPPWWNWKHTVATCSLITVVFIAAILWIRTLRQRVEERTLELRQTMGKLQKETRISATLAERDRLAAEIHDSIEQGLSAIMLQMEAATKLVGQPDEIRRYLTMAKNMAGFSRTEVQHAVWDMQSPLLENSDLPTALRRIAREVSAGDSPRVDLEIAGTAFPLSSAAEHHLLRIAQEAMTNSVKHGNAQTIRLSLRYHPDLVTLEVRDDGAGFDPGTVSTDGGHFGLQGMRIRAGKIGAEWTLRSKPGEGTFIHVSVRSDAARSADTKGNPNKVTR